MTAPRQSNRLPLRVPVAAEPSDLPPKEYWGLRLAGFAANVFLVVACILWERKHGTSEQVVAMVAVCGILLAFLFGVLIAVDYTAPEPRRSRGLFPRPTLAWSPTFPLTAGSFALAGCLAAPLVRDGVPPDSMAALLMLAVLVAWVLTLFQNDAHARFFKPASLGVAAGLALGFLGLVTDSWGGLTLLLAACRAAATIKAREATATA